MKVDILVSTINGGIDNVKNIILPFRTDLNYIISHQYTSNEYLSIPKELIRNDIKIIQIKGKGLSKSRNNVIKNAKGDICILADDDVRYTDDYIDRVKSTYENNEIDVACFKIETNSGEPEYKSYDEGIKCFSLTNRTSVSSIELTFKPDKIKKAGIQFDIRFGIGSDKLIGGEETVFLVDCLKLKFKVCYFPHYIVNHPYENTIKRLNRFDKKRNMVSGAIDYRINGFSAIPRAFKVTYSLFTELKKHKKNSLKYLLERLRGVFYILRTN